MTTDEPVAIVTGGASGIGLATARALLADGMTVAVLDLSTDGVDPALLAVRCDVADDPSVRAAVSSVVDRFGRLDVVVNNAGIGAAGTVADNDDREWHRVFDVNVVGMVRVSRAALPHLRKSPVAAIVNTCSIAATAGLPDRALYSATKGAVLSLTRAMAADHLADGIRVNAVAPGTADTPWVGRLLAAAADPAAERAALAARRPSGPPSPPGSRWAVWSRPTRSAPPWPTWRGRPRRRRPARWSRWTAGCPGCDCAGERCSHGPVAGPSGCPPPRLGPGSPQWSWTASARAGTAAACWYRLAPSGPQPSPANRTV